MNRQASQAASDAHHLQLGGLVLDLSAGELLTAEHGLAGLRRQALDVLLVLGRRAGHVVSKDELMKLVWPGVVVGEGSLTQAISDVRRTLGDTEHRLVRNVARRGYMLVPDTGADVPALSIAVMPLTLLGDASDSDWLADALHGDLVTEVARIQGSLVIARGTAATYKGRSVDPRLVARELRVRHVVLGSLRHDGGQLRLSVTLVNGDHGTQVWAEAFVIERAQLAQALAELATQIGRALLPQLYRSAAEQRAALSALEVSADDLAMRANAIWSRGLSGENTSEALKLLERAVALDSDCVRGWAGLTFMNLHGLFNGWVGDRDATRRRINEATAQLERLDHDGHFTYESKVIQAFLQQDTATMLRRTTAWVERHRHPMAYAGHGMATLLNGLADEAVAALERALRLSPRDTLRAELQYRLAMAHFMAGRYEQACDWALSARDSNLDLPWPPVHAAAMQQLGHTAEAQQAWREHIARHPGFTAEQVVQRLPGANPRLVEARERLASCLAALGMR